MKPNKGFKPPGKKKSSCRWYEGRQAELRILLKKQKPEKNSRRQRKITAYKEKSGKKQ